MAALLQELDHRAASAQALLEAQLTDWPSVGEVARTSGLVLGGVLGTTFVVSLLNLGFGKLAELAFPV